jgi:hypothetical protein
MRLAGCAGGDATFQGNHLGLRDHLCPVPREVAESGVESGCDRVGGLVGAGNAWHRVTGKL